MGALLKLSFPTELGESKGEEGNSPVLDPSLQDSTQLQEINGGCLLGCESLKGGDP